MKCSRCALEFIEADQFLYGKIATNAAQLSRYPMLQEEKIRCVFCAQDGGIVEAPVQEEVQG
jgi:hypothetical protein